MDPRTEVWMQNLVDERDGAALYDGLAKWERDPAKSSAFREMAEAERRHGGIWERKLREAGIPLPPPRTWSRVRPPSAGLVRSGSDGGALSVTPSPRRMACTSAADPASSSEAR